MSIEGGRGNDLENAIAVSLSPSASSNERAQALEFLDRLKSDTNSIDLAVQTFLSPTSTDNAKFFSLQLLEWHLLSNLLNASFQLTAQHINTALLSFVITIVRSFSLPIFLENKLCQIFSILWESLYASYTSFFSEWFEAVRMNPSASKLRLFFLKVCISIDERIVANENSAHITGAKDLMRSRDIPRLISFFSDSVSFSFNSNGESSNRIEIGKCALRCIAVYIRWIDVNLVANDSMLSLILGSIEKNGLFVESLDVFISLIGKGMPAYAKIQLIAQLDISNSVLSAFSSSVADDNSICKLVEVLNVTGVEVCRGIDELRADKLMNGQSEAFAIISSLLPHLIRFVNNPIQTICAHTFPFCAALIDVSKKSPKAMVETNTSMLEKLLNLFMIKMKCPSNFNPFDIEDVDEEFVDFRKSLTTLFENMAHLLPNSIQTTIPSFILNILEQQQKTVDWTEIELALYVLYVSGEIARTTGAGINSTNVLLVSGLDTLFIRVLSLLQVDAARKLAHPTVLAIYMEVLVRFASYNFFEMNADHVQVAIAAFISHPHAIHGNPSKISTQASWHLFAKFIRALKPTRISESGIAEPLLNGFGDLLSVNERENGDVFDKRLELWELAGWVIANGGMGVDKDNQCIEAICGPLFNKLSLLLRSTSSFFSLSPLQLNVIKYSFKALGSLVKDIPSLSSTASLHSFSQIAQLIVSILQASDKSPFKSDISIVAVFALQRLANSMSASVLTYFTPFISCLLTGDVDLQMLNAVIPFINYCTYKYKGQLEAQLMALFIPLLSKSFEWMNVRPTGTDDAILLLELQRNYIAFLSALLSAGLSTVILQQQEREKSNVIVDSILNSVVSFILDAEDVNLQKSSISVLSKIVYNCCPSSLPPLADSSGSSINVKTSAARIILMPGLESYIYKNLMALLFQNSTVRRDAAASLASEFSAFLKSIYGKRGAEFTAYLSSTLSQAFSQPNFNEELLRAFVDGVSNGYNAKGLKKAYTELAHQVFMTYYNQSAA